MSEVLTEKPFDTADPVDTTTVESTTTLTNERGSGEAHLADGTLLEEMKKAVKQIEFYFADANLPYDKFMWTLYMKDPEHWIPIQTVASFKRMRQFSSHGLEWVTNAIRLSDFLQVDETGTKVRRTTEPQPPKNQFERSVYAKGFGDEEHTLQGRLEEFFTRYGVVSAVRMRRDENKKFKNSVFTEFRDFESVNAFLKADPKPTWEGNELLIMSKEDYCEMKIKEKGLTGKGANHRRELLSSQKFDAFREMAKDKANSKKKAAENKDVFLEFLGQKILIKKDGEGHGVVDEKDIPFVKGVTLKFDGCGGDVIWSEIKDPIRERFDGRAPYIKYTRGEDSGLVGFYKPLSEEDIEFVKSTIKTINNNEVTWSSPNEEEEKQFEIERAQAAARHAFNPSRDGGGRGGRGGRGRGGRGRGRGGGGDRRRDNDRNAEAKGKGKQLEAEESMDAGAGTKRRRAVEPDGGPDVGVRGNVAPPVIQSTKKAKLDDGSASTS